MEELEKCPLCENEEIRHFLTCKDHSISKEEFQITRCNKCNFLFTNPRPKESEIGNYYKSEVYISHHDTKKGFIPWIYRLVRNIQFVNKTYLIKTLTGSKPAVLDIGCGTGEFLRYCNALGWITDGVEPDLETRKIANAKNIPVYDTNYLNTSTKKYDVITLWHVLEHVHDLNERLTQISALLNDKGVVIVAVPNPNSYDAKKYKSYWAAYDLPRHLSHFTQNTIQTLFKKYQFNLIKTQPMKYDAFYVSIKSEEYKEKNVLMNIIKGTLSGLISNIRAVNKNEYSSLIYVFKK